jgi:hypothetical protein
VSCLKVGALPRLCDVRRVLLEERAECLRELSEEKKALGPKTASGRRPPSAQVPSADGSCPVIGVGNLSPGPGGLSRVGSILYTQSAVGSMVTMGSEGSIFMSPFSGNSHRILTVCSFVHGSSR